jgi:hypothetical protein
MDRSTWEVAVSEESLVLLVGKGFLRKEFRGKTQKGEEITWFYEWPEYQKYCKCGGGCTSWQL